VTEGADARVTAVATGRAAEARARALLEAAGLRFVAANVRYRFGELDLVMAEGRTLVFVEVRNRGSMRFGGAAASIDGRKRVRLARAAERYLQQAFGRQEPPPCRFDVIAIEGDTPHWIKAAF
jgi:putative endonuclease